MRPILASLCFIVGVVPLVTHAETMGSSDAITSAGIHWKTLGIKEGMADTHITGIVTAPDFVYFATPRGLNQYNRTTHLLSRFTTLDGLPSNNILAILQDGSTLWIGTDQGLACLTNNRIQTIHDPLLLNKTITAFAQKESILYIGSNQGVLWFDKKTNQITRLQDIPAETVSSLRIDHQGLLISLSHGQVRFFDLVQGATEELSLDINPLQNNVNAIGVNGNYCWFATDGSGVVQYDKVNRQWKTITLKTNVDKFLTALVEDGKYIWFATFYGLYRYDQSTNQWVSYLDPRLTESELTALAMDGEFLWVGTRKNGIIYGLKNSPTIKVLLTRRYFGNEKAFITARVTEQKNSRTEITYSSQTFPDVWLTQFTRLDKKGDTVQAEIDFNQLPDDLYQFKLSVTNPLGENEEIFTLIKETQPLTLTFDIGFLKEGLNKINGSYQNPSIDRIILQPGKVLAVLDRINKRFSAELMLQSSNKALEAEAFDFTGRSAIFKRAITISPATHLDITSDTPAFSPGEEQVRFKISQQFLAPLAHWEFIIASEDGIHVRKFEGSSSIPDEIIWEGKNQFGDYVDNGIKFFYHLTVHEKDGLEITTNRQVVISKMKVEKQERGLVINLSSNFIFDSGEAEMRPGHMVLLDEIARLINQYDQCKILIEGHTDNVPIHTPLYPNNEALSAARAESIANHLITHFHFDQKRITIQGYGDKRPLASNQTPAGRMKNRRVEVIIMEK